MAEPQKLEEKMMKEFNEITHKTYKQQAVFFLNAYWPEHQRKEKKFENLPEQVFGFWKKFLDIDRTQWEEVHKKLWKTGWTEGNSLDEFFSHKSMMEFLIWEFGRNVPEMMKRPQGDNQEEIMAAQAALESVQKALVDLQERLEKQKHALEAQKEAEEKVKKAESDLKAAVDDLAKQEADYKHQIDTLTNKAHDDKAGAVSRNKAANELAQLKEKDPLPLRKAKITQEAALRAVQVQRKAAEEATAACEAEKVRVEQAIDDTQQKLAKAQDKLDEGSLWWIQRELDEAKSFMPGSKKF